MRFTAANAAEVDAFEIVNITPHARFSEWLMLYLGDMTAGTAITAFPEIARYAKPKIGDYYVVNPGGFDYVVPKQAFEQQFSPTPARLDAGQLKN